MLSNVVVCTEISATWLAFSELFGVTAHGQSLTMGPVSYPLLPLLLYHP
jgi:hypothetical protein